MQNVLLATVTPQHHDQADDVKAHAGYAVEGQTGANPQVGTWRDMARYGAIRCYTAAIRPRYGAMWRDTVQYSAICEIDQPD